LLVSRDGLARRADGVDSIIFGPSSTLERPHLDHRFTGFEQVHDQAGGEAAGSFQRPGPPAGSVLLGPGQHPCIAGAVGGVGQMRTDATGAGIEHGQVDGVSVRVASDDVVVVICEHDHCGCPSIRG